MRKLRKGIWLKFWNRDVVVNGYVRKSGDVGGIPERDESEQDWWLKPLRLDS
ncbi:hypothetical protein YC2023_072345 [Brassica napus]